MTTIKDSNGVELTYDETINVGDIVTAYHSGYHKITEITPRYEIGGSPRVPLFTYVLVAKADGTLAKRSSITKECDASFCRHVKQELAKTITKKKEELARLESLQIIFENNNGSLR